MKRDVGFDGLANHFDKNIYGNKKGWLREWLVWRELELNLDHNTPLTILDCGCGTGRMALRLAQKGHQLVLNDLSEEMLQKSRALFEANQLTERMKIIPGPLQQLNRHLPQKYDLVLCHAVLEWLAHPHAALPTLLSYLKPGGKLSLMFYNKYALQFHKVVKTHYFNIHNPTPPPRKSKLTPPNPLDPKEVIEALVESGHCLLSRSGIRVFWDYLENGDRYEEVPKDLIEAEWAFRQKEPFLWLGRYFHVMVEKPESVRLNRKKTVPGQK